MNNPRRKVAALFVRSESIYKRMRAVSAWDMRRDARKYDGPWPVICHPPCRAWGRLRAFAKPRLDERDLARWAVVAVRKWGGVLEHPTGSTLWADMCLPRPGAVDAYGGTTIQLPQRIFGHDAEKSTWLYVVGVAVIPPLPTFSRRPVKVVSSSKRNLLPEMSKADRERTPAQFARWLVRVAARADVRTTAVPGFRIAPRWRGRCACGCGQQLTGRSDRRTFSVACRKRLNRKLH